MSLPSTAVIGLGPMGGPIARNLIAAGARVTVWNRTRDRTVPFAELGATAADDLTATAADVALSVLPDVRHLRDLLTHDVLDAYASAGTVVVVMSTTGPGQVRDLASELGPRGIRVVDAPMSGGVKGASEGSLSLMIGGADEDVAAIMPVLEILGGTIRHLGPLGAGSLTKLCNQVVVGATLTALAEALGLARAAGLDAETVVEVLEGGLADSEVLRQKRSKLIAREYSLGGNAVNQLKDLRYASAAAAAAEVPVRLTPVLQELFEEVCARGDGDLDHSAVQELFLRR